MPDLFKLPKTFSEKAKYFYLEIALILAAIAVTAVSVFLYFSGSMKENAIPDNNEIVLKSAPNSDKLFVDVSGSVNKPGLYEASNTDRIQNMIEKAGGLSETADRDFFARNFNLARVVSDQEKIHIPSVWEVSNGYFAETKQWESNTGNQTPAANNQSLIDINHATLEELDTLPGVGKVSAQKVIDGRPFKALQELIDKKVIGSSVFENIKNLITVNQ